MFLFSAYARHELQFLSEAANSQRGCGRQVVLYDIGANIGQHSICLSRLVDSVHSFEPFGPVADRFREHVELNDLHNVILHQVALSNHTGLSRFHSPPPENCGSGSLTSLTNASDVGVIDQTCEVSTFDAQEFVLSRSLPLPNVMKIDAEGAEGTILVSLAPLLSLCRPIILVEVSEATASNWNSEVSRALAFGQLYQIRPAISGYKLNHCPRPSGAGDYVVLPSEHLNDAFRSVLSNGAD
jgi:FkbM family methyltransferase